MALTDAGLNLASYAGEIVQMEANLQKKAQEYKECREGSIHQDDFIAWYRAFAGNTWEIPGRSCRGYMCSWSPVRRGQ